VTDDQPYEPTQPSPTQVRLVMAAVVLLLLAMGIWGYSWLRGQWANDSAKATTTATVTSGPSTSTTPKSTPTPSVQVATPVQQTPGSTPSATATPSVTTSTRPAVDLPRGARVCDGSSDVRAAAGTPRTSCTFALSVRDAWVSAGGGDRSVRAHSAVTDQDYTMACSGSPVTTCRGGNSAVVYLY
jgi:hypothetical protein